MELITHPAGLLQGSFSISFIFSLMTHNFPTYSLLLSDTYGSFNDDPLQAPFDPDVTTLTDLAIVRDAIEHGDQELPSLRYNQKVPIRGREEALAHHLLHLLVDWHDQYEDILRSADIYNGVFINAASRDRIGGIEPFSVAETDNNLRVVTSNLSYLSGIKNRVKSLKTIPNQDNHLFPNGTQFRSEVTHLLLRRNNTKAKLVERNTSDIPHDSKDNDLRVQFVDTFGNLITGNERTTEEILPRLTQAAHSERRRIKIIIGENGSHQTLPGYASTSLEAGETGKVLAYENGRHVDIVRKWLPGESAKVTTEKSAYVLAGRPTERQAKVRIAFESEEGFENL